MLEMQFTEIETLFMSFHGRRAGLRRNSPGSIVSVCVPYIETEREVKMLCALNSAVYKKQTE